MYLISIECISTINEAFSANLLKSATKLSLSDHEQHVIKPLNVSIAAINRLHLCADCDCC